MTRQWENHEVLHVMNNAGFHSIETMAHYLARTPDDIEMVLGSLGIDGALLCPEIKECPHCHRWRSSFGARGDRCRSCSLKKNIERTTRKAAEVFTCLPPHLKELYSDTEAKTGLTTFDVAPKRPPKQPGQDPTKTRLDLVAYTIACEQFEIKKLQRIYKAKRRRLERMKKHLEEWRKQTGITEDKPLALFEDYPARA